MRLLVLGGTAWLGGGIAEVAIERGHQVTCLARGAEVPRGAELIRADRDADDALSRVAERSWDAVIDLARQPGHVRRAVRDLEPVAGSYLFISSVSVYASHSSRGGEESDPLLAPLTFEVYEDLNDYGAAKVACENAVLDAFGPDRSTILRPGLIGGPGDPTQRTDYWPWRFANPAVPGRALVPQAEDLPTSVIDVRDLALWTVRCAEGEVTGVFNAMGPPTPFRVHLAAAREAAAEFAVAPAEMVAAPPPWLLERDVAPWSGPRSLPLWLPGGDHDGMGDRSTAQAGAAGLTCRPLLDTLRDALAVRLAAPDRGAPRTAGLTDADERALLLDLENAPPR